MNRTLAFVLTALLGISLPATAFAIDMENVQLHGFVSQGYLKSTDNNYFGDTHTGTFEYNEFGLSFAVPLADNLRFGAQLFSRDLGTIGNNKLNVDWAFMDYSWKDWLGFRAGRIKMPFGLYNRQRDVDSLRTFVLLPQSVYPESIRDFIVAYNGAAFYGTSNIKKLGYIDYEIFGGTIDVNKDTTFVDDVTSRSLIYHPALLNSPLSSIPTEDINITFEHMEGGMLMWNTPLSGLRLGGSFMKANAKMTTSFAMTVPGPGGTTTTVQVPITGKLPVKYLYSLSTEYEVGDLTLAAEYLDMDCALKILGTPDLNVNLGGWYASASYNVVDWLSLGTYYMEFYPNNGDKDGKEMRTTMQLAGLPPLPDYYAYQKEIVASAKFNIKEWWCVKLETHFINGVGLIGIPQENFLGQNYLEEDWVLFAVKTSLNF